MAIPTSTSIYGRVLPNSSRAIVISKVAKVTGFKYPISEDPKNGYFSKQSGQELSKSALKMLIRTERGERFMLPDYGCNLRKYLMEPMDDTTFNLIKKELQESIRKYMQRIAVTKLQIFESLPSFAFSKVLSVKLFCRLKDEENTSFDIGVTI